MNPSSSFTLSVYLTLITGLISAQPTPQSRYVWQEVLIPMRDGIRLNTVIYTPKMLGEPLPIVFRRTPYGAEQWPFSDQILYTKVLADEGYIFVAQDRRGRYQSKGTFEMQRFSRSLADSKAIDESTGAYDTIDWLLKNIPNTTGKVRMYGTSYDGWNSSMPLWKKPPNLIRCLPSLLN